MWFGGEALYGVPYARNPPRFWVYRSVGTGLRWLTGAGRTLLRLSWVTSRVQGEHPVGLAQLLGGRRSPASGAWCAPPRWRRSGRCFGPRPRFRRPRWCTRPRPDDRHLPVHAVQLRSLGDRLHAGPRPAPDQRLRGRRDGALQGLQPVHGDTHRVRIRQRHPAGSWQPGGNEQGARGPRVQSEQRHALRLRRRQGQGLARPAGASTAATAPPTTSCRSSAPRRSATPIPRTSPTTRRAVTCSPATAPALELYDINPVNGTFGDGNDVVTHFDLARYGLATARGLESTPAATRCWPSIRRPRRSTSSARPASSLRTLSLSAIPTAHQVGADVTMAPTSDPDDSAVRHGLLDRRPARRQQRHDSAPDRRSPLRDVAGGGSASRTLTVQTAGAGSGTVTGPGISCPGDCTETYPDGQQVTLTETPDSELELRAGWTGDCSGTGACRADHGRGQAGDRHLQPAPAPAHAHRPNRRARAAATVIGSRGSTAPATAPRPTPTASRSRLTATPERRLELRRLDRRLLGDRCLPADHGRGQAGDRHLQPAPAAPDAHRPNAGHGHGTVTGPGINCPGDCTETYADGQQVSPDRGPGQRLELRRLGRRLLGTGPCQLTMDADKQATATFNSSSSGSLSIPIGTGAGRRRREPERNRASDQRRHQPGNRVRGLAHDGGAQVHRSADSQLGDDRQRQGAVHRSPNR